MLKNAFTAKYTPSEKMSVDESLLVYKGRLHFRQYIKSKRSRFGIKIFKLVDSNRVTIRCKVYTGTMETEDDFSKSESVALNLMENFWAKDIIYTLITIIHFQSYTVF